MCNNCSYGQHVENPHHPPNLDGTAAAPQQHSQPITPHRTNRVAPVVGAFCRDLQECGITDDDLEDLAECIEVVNNREDGGGIVTLCAHPKLDCPLAV